MESRYARIASRSATIITVGTRLCCLVVALSSDTHLTGLYPDRDNDDEEEEEQKDRNTLQFSTQQQSLDNEAFSHDNHQNDTTTSSNDDSRHPKKWSHTSDRKPKGYWSLQRVIVELYDYVDGVKQQHGRPAGWMPRPNEMTASGRDDLKQAMARFGGAKQICQLARMVPFREWYYFEGQLDLLLQLRDYMDEYPPPEDEYNMDSDDDGATTGPPNRYKTFPSVSDIRRNGYESLHSLIQYYGGRKFLATRLSMEAPGAGGEDALDFGPFDLEFGIRLLTHVRQDQLLHKTPPLAKPVILMPTPAKLLTPLQLQWLKTTTTTTSGTRQYQDGQLPQINMADIPEDENNDDGEGLWLHNKIVEYGGYENVARRLGLAFRSSSSSSSTG